VDVQERGRRDEEEQAGEIERGIGTAMGERQYGGCVTSVCINARCLPPLLEPRCRCCGIDPTTRNDFLLRGTRAPNETFNPKAAVTGFRPERNRWIIPLVTLRRADGRANERRRRTSNRDAQLMSENGRRETVDI
jgi:hypothetical protein